MTMTRIPKEVHVVWVGPNEIPEKERKLLKINTNVLKDYRFTVWNNINFSSLIPSNLPELHKYVDHVIRLEKWAFLSDLIKVLAIQKYGGWAIDADNEFVGVPSAYERFRFVTGFENWNGKISPITAVWGAVPEHRFSQAMLSVYISNPPEILVSTPNTTWLTEILLMAGARLDNSRQYIEYIDVQLFPDYVFCGPPRDNETIALHHFSASWK